METQSQPAGDSDGPTLRYARAQVGYLQWLRRWSYGSAALGMLVASINFLRLADPNITISLLRSDYVFFPLGILFAVSFLNTGAVLLVLFVAWKLCKSIGESSYSTLLHLLVHAILAMAMLGSALWIIGMYSYVQ